MQTTGKALYSPLETEPRYIKKQLIDYTESFWVYNPLIFVIGENGLMSLVKNWKHYDSHLEEIKNVLTTRIIALGSKCDIFRTNL